MAAPSASEFQRALVGVLVDDYEDRVYPPNWVWNELGELRDEPVPDFGTVSAVVQDGGEGQGDRYFIVWKLTDENGDEYYFRADGYYSSYEGVEWDGAELRQVTPREKTIVVYE